VIAEGAEKQAQYDYLRELGCDPLQAFWSGKPMPAKMLDELPERESA
jgi:EAL domain-containing protein (putative c-di-GMP-specific phosphodiesterase class I)